MNYERRPQRLRLCVCQEIAQKNYCGVVSYTPVVDGVLRSTENTTRISFPVAVSVGVFVEFICCYAALFSHADSQSNQPSHIIIIVCSFV